MKHGTFWVVADGQDTDKVYTDYGVHERHDEFTIPLKTIESDDEFSKTEERFLSVRWFEPMTVK